MLISWKFIVYALWIYPTRKIPCWSPGIVYILKKIDLQVRSPEGLKEFEAGKGVSLDAQAIMDADEYWRKNATKAETH